MLTLEKLRLVNWHYFEDNIIQIGNRCLLAGDNGSGKSTVIDAIQYVMAASLRMAKFNSAADERRGGGRDLTGYVRCKAGSESSEYRRGDTVAHIMLEWSTSDVKESFACGVCIEAWRDNHYSEHFWLGTNIQIENVPTQSDGGIVFMFRQFKNIMSVQNVVFYDSKHLYIRDLTNRLGVWKRQQDVNPYLDALTRSIGFRPLDSIDKFVCDFILDENPVSIQDMKQNLENYKEADREAKAAVAKIEALKKICTKADEWQNYSLLILKQCYLKLEIEFLMTVKKKEDAMRGRGKTENLLNSVMQKAAVISRKQIEREQELRAVDMALSTNDTYKFYEEIKLRIERTQNELVQTRIKTERYGALKKQCEALLGRGISEDFDSENEAVGTEFKNRNAEYYRAQKQKNECTEEIRAIKKELAEIERGILRYPDSPRFLKSALEEAGIEAFFLADAVEVCEPEWVNAVEGYLNTRRFALLVNPEDFQKALEVYNKLPRNIAGVFLPNLARMRGAKVRKGSLAEIVKADAYARIYIDYVLGAVMRADISSLKSYECAITKECMTYGNHTASRIKEEAYGRHYLGRSALADRKKSLLEHLQNVEADFSKYEKAEREASNYIEICRRIISFLPELKYLFAYIARYEELESTITKDKNELEKIDISTFRQLEAKRGEIAEVLQLLKDDYGKVQYEKGRLENQLLICKQRLDELTRNEEEKNTAIKNFALENPLVITECESYASEKLSSATAESLNSTYEAELKKYRSGAEASKKEYSRLVRDYEVQFHFLLGMEPDENTEAETLLKRLETSELPAYREKISRAFLDAEKEFRDHFISRLNEHIEEARESFNEINETLRTLHFGRDQYMFSLEELPERRTQIQVIREAAKIPSSDLTLFEQFNDTKIKEAAERFFRTILNSPLDSKELRDLCDYRKYYRYDIIIKETDAIDSTTGDAARFALSKVLKEKSGGEVQTPYYVAIAASFYRFYKARPEDTVRLVIFDEAFNRMDDERISKILTFYKSLNLQIITSVPPEKIEAIAPYMDRINVISRSGTVVRVRNCSRLFKDSIQTQNEGSIE